MSSHSVSWCILHVIFRYAISYSLTFSEELARYLFVWSVFLASAVCLRQNSHAAVEIFVGMLSPRIRRGVLVLSTLFTIGFFALVSIKGIEITRHTIDQTSASLGVPMSAAYAAMPVGGFLMLIYSLERLVGILRSHD